MTRIAIVQHTPCFDHLQKSLEKAKALIEKASKEAVDMIVFGECWFSGYPAWIDYCGETALWDHEPTKKAWSKIFKNSIEIPGEAIEILQSLAKKNEVYLIFGANEVILKGKGNSSIYNSAFIINDKGELINHHRKLIPTHTERLIHANGDGEGLRSVETNFGNIGTLICWEHWMPLARQAMHDEGEDIHFALWPYVKEMNIVACRQYAHEGKCYVVAVGQTMTVEDFPSGLQLPDHLEKNPEQYVLKGGSCVIGPDGEFIMQPVYDQEDIFYVDLPSKEELIKEKMNLAVSGHYQRWDVFDFRVNRRRIT